MQKARIDSLIFLYISGLKGEQNGFHQTHNGLGYLASNRQTTICRLLHGAFEDFISGIKEETKDEKDAHREKIVDMIKQML